MRCAHCGTRRQAARDSLTGKLTDLALQVPIDQERLERMVNHSALPSRNKLDAKLARLEHEKLLPWLGDMLGVPARDALEELRRVMLPRLRVLCAH